MCCADIIEAWTSRPCRLDSADFFERLGPNPFAFLYGDGAEGRWLILGQDPLWVCRDSAEPLPAFHRSGDLPPFFPDLIGHLSYEYGDRQVPPAAKPFRFPDCHLVLYRRLQLYDRQLGILYSGERSGPRAEPVLHGLRAGPFRARKAWDSDSPESYRAKVARVREQIAKGNVYQVNLTRQERWSFQGDLRSFARSLFAANPAPFSALVAGPDFSIVSSSPERFLRIRDGGILASPIKGTAPRSADPEADAGQRAGLLASPKNLAELAMITDLMRNDLSRVCSLPSVAVLAYPRLESFANVHHLVADVAGSLLPGLTLDRLLRAVFPGGSITGCPKPAAMALIRELESVPRMVYTGALGWCSHDLAQADFNIAIRTAWASSTELLFGVGGGVVWDSDPAEEYLETVHKGRSLVQCLSS
jgi:para-aminobenzoate synthetase component 1